MDRNGVILWHGDCFPQTGTTHAQLMSAKEGEVFFQLYQVHFTSRKQTDLIYTDYVLVLDIQNSFNNKVRTENRKPKHFP